MRHQPDQRDRGNRVADRGRGVGGGRRAGPRLLLELGQRIELSAPGGSERGRQRRPRQQTFNFNFTDTFLLPPAHRRAALPRLRYVGYRLVDGRPHVAGVAAMLMQQGVTDPAAIERSSRRPLSRTPGRDNTFVRP
jgi:hypothetical protein